MEEGGIGSTKDQQQNYLRTRIEDVGRVWAERKSSYARVWDAEVNMEGASEEPRQLESIIEYRQQ